MFLNSLVITSLIHSLKFREVLSRKSIAFAEFFVFAIKAYQRVDTSKALFILTPFKDSGFDKDENSF